MLAERSGVPQSVISDYERGRREPSFGAVDLILRAADVELRATPVSALEQVRRHRDEILRRLGEAGMTDVSVFGSVARGDETRASDIDLLVDVAPGTGLFPLLRVQGELEALLGRPVDLVPRTALKDDAAMAAAREAVAL